VTGDWRRLVRPRRPQTAAMIMMMLWIVDAAGCAAALLLAVGCCWHALLGRVVGLVGSGQM
jgi:hypothetical protein